MGPSRNLAKKEFVAENLADFVNLTELIRDQWDFEEHDACRPWFRGQQRKHWNLIPSIFRLDCFDRESEDNIREEFATRAPALSRFEPVPSNDWDLYFLMQHYGAPTRLLDWTESPTIALYFAVRDNPGYFDSAVWMLDPYELNRLVARKGEVVSPGAQGVSKADTRRVKPWLPDRWSRVELPAFPLAIFPTHIARRISSQRACFTIHGRQLLGFSRFIRSSDSCLKKIVVPGHAIRGIRRSLESSGIDDTTIFPDLEGLGRALATSYRQVKDKTPHQGVYVRLGPNRARKSGVGVFAIRRVPKGALIFSGENEEILWVKRESLPEGGTARKLYDDFGIIKPKYYGCPTSFNRLTPAWFLNESKKPNARCDENYHFYAAREIAQGEEITVDYSTLNEYPDGVR